MATPEEEAAAKAESDRIAAEAKAVADAAAEAARKADADKLGEGGKSALDAERKARKEAEKVARDAQAKLDKLEAEKLSDSEREKKRADDAEAKLGPATEKVRRANVTLALADLGLQGARAKAAAKLLEGVEFDADTDEPTNLDDRLTAARAEYGEEMFKGAKTPAPNVNGGEGTAGGSPPPVLTAQELAAAESFEMTPEEYVLYKDPSYQPPAKKAAA